MKFEYKREIIHGNADEVLKKVNALGAEGWEVVHVGSVMIESHTLAPATVVWIKRSK